MNEKASKIVLLIELLVLMIPTTLFFAVYGSSMVFWSVRVWHDVEGFVAVLTLLFCALFIFAAWYAATYFMRHGRAKFKHFPTRWKIIGYVAGAYVLLSWGYYIYFELSQFYMLESSFLVIPFFGVFGTPLLLPLLHLALEWKKNS